MKVLPCEKGLEPLRVIAPALPSKLDNEFQGTVEVGFLVTLDGKVSSPHIHHRNLYPVGHGGKAPVGYDKAVLDAVSEWRYPTRAYACYEHTTVEFKIE